MSSSLQAANYNYNIGAQTLGITLGTGQSLTVTVSGPEIRFTLDIGTFSQTGPNTASGSNTSTIAILASTVATSLTVNNTGVFPGTNNVTFSGNSSISTGTLAIDLSGDGVGTVSFTGGFDVSVSTEMSISTNRNISVGSGSQLTAMNAASILFEANQQPTVTSGSFIGISLFGAAVVETTGSGALTLKGRGGDTGNSQRGIQLTSASEVNGGTGNVTIEGTGGASTGNFNWGVDVAFNSKITSSGGDIEVTGTGGGSASSWRNHGVSVGRDCEIFAGGTGMVMVEGTGGNTTNTDNYGVYVNAFSDGDFAKITSAGGDVSVKGTGGGSGDFRNNLGVYVHNGGEISAGGMGNVSVEGTGGNSTGSRNDGVVLLLNASKITSSGGAVSVKGTGGGGGGIGVSIDRGEITAGGMGQVSVEGNGASIASNSNQNHGVLVNSAPSIISSSGGDVVVKGTAGGNGNSNNNYGVNIFGGGAISAGGMGSVSVEGSGGSATGNGNRGVYILGQGTDPTRIFSSGGEVLITGIEGGGAFGFEVGGDGRVTTVDDGGGITILANSISIGNSANISTQSGHTCAIAPYTSGTAIDLGSFADPLGGPIGLTDAELDRITTGTLIIGDANSGTITVSAAISRPSSTNMELRSGADITFNQEVNTSGGNLLLAPGDAPAAVYPDFSGTDATVNTLSFASDLAIAINGTTPGNGTGSTYSQLAVVGEINLSGVDLILNGSHTPVSGEVFTIVDNDGVEPIMGTFTGLPEGATIPNFLGSGLDATITYMGGDGNDAELTVVVNCDISIANVAVTDETCPGEGDGTITATATCGSCAGGNADIRYSIDNSDFSNTTGVFTGLAPGTYTVYVQDVNDPSCTDSDGPHTVAVGMEPDAPTLVITDNTCPSSDGVIVAMGCGTGTVAEYATGPDGPWSASPPAYGTTAFTVYARCRDEANGCVSGTDQGTTSPTICPVLSGSIVWENDLSTPVPGATVALTGDDTGDDDTDGMGDYAIPTDGGSSLTLTPAKTGDVYNGVDAADVARIQQHVTFIDRFDDGYKAIAADVNQSNSVTGLDAAVIFHAINGNPNAAAIFENPSWRFVDSTHTFMDENAPWPFPEDISLMNVMADVLNQSFVGVKMGDVNGTWATPVPLTSPPLSLMAQDVALKAGQTLRVPFRANGLPDVAAWQFALRFDTDYLRFERALPTAAFPLKEENFGAWQAEQGELRSVFAVPQGLALPKDEVLFELEFQVVRGGLRLSEALRLDDGILDGRVYNTALNGGKVALAFKAVETRAVETRSIASLPPAEAALGFALEQNIPNPFGNETLIRFHLPEAGEAVFSVHDVQGRLLYEQRGFLDAGGHEVRLDAARLSATGVLSYTLRTGAHSATRRMVLVR